MKIKVASKKNSDKTNQKDKTPLTIKLSSNLKKRKDSKYFKFTKKQLKILWIVIAFVIVAIITFIVCNIIKGEPIDKSYFVTDDTKVSINMNPTGTDRNTSNSSSSLVQTHIVYTYDGDNVTGLKTYFEYPDSDTAKAAFESLKTQPEFENAEIKDNYVIVTAKPETYQGLTASDVKQQEEAIRQFQEKSKQKEEKKK